MPAAFKGAAVEVRDLAIDQPPQRAVLHIDGTGVMNEAQFRAFMAALAAAARPK